MEEWFNDLFQINSGNNASLLPNPRTSTFSRRFLDVLHCWRPHPALYFICYMLTYNEGNQKLEKGISTVSQNKFVRISWVGILKVIRKPCRLCDEYYFNEVILPDINMIANHYTPHRNYCQWHYFRDSKKFFSTSISVRDIN